MSSKEATARIKINKMLEEAGWRFIDEEGKKANIKLESNVRFDQLNEIIKDEPLGKKAMNIIIKNSK